MVFTPPNKNKWFSNVPYLPKSTRPAPCGGCDAGLATFESTWAEDASRCDDVQEESS